MKIIKIAQEISYQEDEISIRDIFDKVSSDVAHYNYPALVDFAAIDEILKRHPRLIGLIHQYWVELIKDNRAYLYRFIYPSVLKEDDAIKELVRKKIIEMYNTYMTNAIGAMIKYDETDKIFASSKDGLWEAFYDYVFKFPEYYEKHCPHVLKGQQGRAGSTWEFAKNAFLDKIVEGGLVLNRYERLPPELKNEEVIKKMTRYLVNIFFSEPYLYETDCPIDFKNNKKILEARKTGWINHLNQKNQLYYATLPNDLKKDNDFIKYREPAKQALLKELINPANQTNQMLVLCVNKLLEEFRRENFLISLFWKQKVKYGAISVT